MNDHQVVLHLTDAHFPYEDKRACRIALDAIHILQPDVIVNGGDMMDCYAISRFDKDPARKETMADELAAAHNFLWLQRQHVDDEQSGRRTIIHYLEGNHEARLRKYLWRTARALAHVSSICIKELLRLDELGIQYHQYGKILRVGDLNFTHGSTIRQDSGCTALRESARIGASVAIGHCHRLGRVWKTTDHGTFHGWEGGCLCKMDQEYLLQDMALSTPNWQHGLLAFILNSHGRLVDELVLDLNIGDPQTRLRKWIGGGGEILPIFTPTKGEKVCQTRNRRKPHSNLNQQMLRKLQVMGRAVTVPSTPLPSSLSSSCRTTPNPCSKSAKSSPRKARRSRPSPGFSARTRTTSSGTSSTAISTRSKTRRSSPGSNPSSSSTGSSSRASRKRPSS